MKKLLLITAVFFLLASAGYCQNNSLQSVGSVVDTNQQMASKQSIKVDFIADVVQISLIKGPLPPKNKLKGYLIDNAPSWELSLQVLPHNNKIPFQPGLRTCYIANPQEVFGTPVDKIKGRYEFSFIWNIGVAGKPEFENFKASPSIDTIAQLVERLSKTHGLWINGISPEVKLSAEATTDQVLSKVFQMISFDQGRVTSYAILETKEVQIEGSLPDKYTAVLVKTNLGNKIVLLKYEGKVLGWWSRVYDNGS